MPLLSKLRLGAACMVILSTWVTSGAAATNTHAQELNELLHGLTTFKADVRQLITESSGGVLEESEILFKLRRPHGFYWETLTPFPELILTNGETLWNYQPDLLQLTIEDWDPADSELAAQLLSGETGAIAEEYDIEAVPVAEQGREFILQPRDPASLYERVVLYFGPMAGMEQPQLESILLVNTNGQRTFWEFNNREVNQPLAADEFIFVIPDDDMLDVIDNRFEAPDAPGQL